MKLGFYYIDLNKRLGEDFSEYEFDDNGVPLSRFHRLPGWKHNPITVCQYGLFHFNNYLRTSSSLSKDIFLSQANWLLEHAKDGPNKSAVWFYQFDLPFYDIKAPWISGMAQGQAISVLLRAFQISGEKKYLEAAQAAWRIFDVKVKDGGIISEFPDGLPLIEEYPSSSKRSSVLNGFIFAIFGVYDYFVYLQDKDAQKKFHLFIESLKENMFRYDSGYWSYYELANPRRLTAKFYHRIHIKQLESLFRITNDPFFKQFAERWQKYLFSPFSNFKWFLKKVHQKLVVQI
ncbi:hypothetical protein ISS22_01200 [candidate division KSB1 bacterium]|nr:hypothetical protein [candidate division KSB1 bacterium]